ncbi:MAG: glycine cleavage system aminomethyltransferase GcvT [Bacteroidetes Order II. Incertae sedis bacterium]|nr:glycine cleavage system aminomethyltransferase GcvT [Bacteroidetes Order II. bacterium]
MSQTVLKRTPLYDIHKALGAKMVSFAGFEMPVVYKGIIEEHMAVRKAAGLFDVSHMGEVRVSGPQALAFVQSLVSNDAAKLYDGRVMYAVMCNPEGGIVDDLLVYRLGSTEFLLVINASNIEKDFDWMQANNGMGAVLENVSDQMALMALQGPKAMEIFSHLTSISIQNLPYYHAIRPESGTFFECKQALISHTGYTGESGIEIYCENDKATEIWEALMQAGAPYGLEPCGLGARDTLRMEAGYCLYGNDIDHTTNPLEAGLGWVTKMQKDHFIGKGVLEGIKEKGVERKLVAFVLEERGIPRAGYPLLDQNGQIIGEVTSGTQSPVLSQGIGMGYVSVASGLTVPESAIWIDVRGRKLAARVKKAPLHKIS